MNQKPLSITADRSVGQLTIRWEDEHISVYSFELLRLGCPCAECRGGHDKMSRDPDHNIFNEHIDDSSAIHLKNLVGVGSYAITPVWEDGHDYGIYTWHYLREMCPCTTCQKDRSKDLKV